MNMEEAMQKSSKSTKFHAGVFLFLFLSIFFVRTGYVCADDYSITQIEKHFSYLIEEERDKCERQHQINMRKCMAKHGVEIKGLGKCWQKAHNLLDECTDPKNLVANARYSNKKLNEQLTVIVKKREKNLDGCIKKEKKCLEKCLKGKQNKLDGCIKKCIAKTQKCVKSVDKKAEKAVKKIKL